MLYSMAKDETYYQRLKQENQDLKAMISWADESFLFDSDVDIRTIYGYLKTKPEAAKFIYKKYPKARDSLKEICDRDNPLCLPDVLESLSEVIRIDTYKEDAEQVKEELFRLMGERSKLQDEIDKQEKEYDEISQRVESIQKQSEELDRQTGNITDPEILNQVKSFCGDVKRFSDSVLKSGDINELTLKIRKLTSDQVQTLNLLGERANNTLKKISDEDALSELKLSEKRQKFKEEIEKEKEIALNEMTGKIIIANKVLSNFSHDKKI